MDSLWIDWAQSNAARGCNKDELIATLLENDFDPLEIIQTLCCVPQRPDLIATINQRLAPRADWLPTRQQELAAYEAIDAISLPGARRIQTDLAKLYVLDDFLSSDECADIIKLIRHQCHPSLITTSDEPDKYFRTSKTCELSLMEEPLAKHLDQRIADYMEFEVERSEGIQGQYYQVGDEFKTHTDYFQPGTTEYEKFAGDRGQRTWTFMIYLNDVEAGGETLFPKLNLAFTPKQGQAVIWNSIRADGSVNPATSHWAKPIIKGEKFVITKWFRTLGGLTTLYQPLQNH